MMRINLLPLARQNGIVRVNRVRRWAVGIGAGAAIITTSLAGSMTMWTDNRADLRSQVSEQRAAQADLTIEISSLAFALREKLDAIRNASKIGNSPDWSILLALIADRTGEHVVLTLITLETANRDVQSPTGTKAPVQPTTSTAMLLLDGVGTSAHQVSLFSVRLEDMNLFERVVIERSARSPIGQTGSIAFTIRCLVREGER